MSDDPAEVVAAAEARGCYCGLWVKAPDHLREQGLPVGYCGKCCVCGRPGHLRHFPGPVPVTDAWCDRHYAMTLWFHPRGEWGRRLWWVLVMAVAIAVVTIL